MTRNPLPARYTLAWAMAHLSELDDAAIVEVRGHIERCLEHADPQVRERAAIDHYAIAETIEARRLFGEHAGTRTLVVRRGPDGHLVAVDTGPTTADAIFSSN